MAFGSALFSRSESSSNFKKVFKSLNWAVFYLLFKKKRMEQSELFMSNPDIDIALKFYNFADTDFAKKMVGITLPGIKIN